VSHCQRLPWYSIISDSDHYWWGCRSFTLAHRKQKYVIIWQPWRSCNNLRWGANTWQMSQIITFLGVPLTQKKTYVPWNLVLKAQQTFHFFFFFFFSFTFLYSFFFPFFIRYLAHLHFQCYTKSPPYPPTPTPLPTHSPPLALAFPCTGAHKVCVSNGPLFPVMAD
jgi:hypothetical protein